MKVDPFSTEGKKLLAQRFGEVTDDNGKVTLFYVHPGMSAEPLTRDEYTDALASEVEKRNAAIVFILMRCLQHKSDEFVTLIFDAMEHLSTEKLFDARDRLMADDNRQLRKEMRDKFIKGETETFDEPEPVIKTYSLASKYGQ